VRYLAGLALVAALWCRAAWSCNPEPPRPPILEGHEYDAVAREYLAREATTIAIGRYTGKIDFIMEGDAGAGSRQPDYVFDLYQGWKTELPARLAVPGYWVPCRLRLTRGASYLLYLDGETPLFMLEAEASMDELEAFGDLDWFYLPSGQLVLQSSGDAVGEDAESGD
jgi:hypothetical protein